MPNKRIEGTLTPSNKSKAADPVIRRNLYNILRENRIREIVVWGTKWEEDGIEFKRSYSVHSGRNDAFKFITALDAVMKSESAKALKLNGRITITLETKEEPIVFRVTVKEGKMSYQEAGYVWSEGMTV